ncbi:MAG: PIN domain-containing protein, partial [Phycisphaerales bacterium JB038]
VRGRDDARAFHRALTEFVTVAPTDTEGFRFAAALPLKDLEDAMQIAAAQACGARFIATRKVADFRHSPISARSPADLLEEVR